jgi:predicted enzyme related to lactoylglutathione lyase
MQHAIDWFEIPCTNIDRAQAFYEAVLGRTLARENYSGPGMTMAVFPADGGEHAVRGALQHGPGVAAPSATGTVIYLHAVGELSTVLARVVPAGGSISMPHTALPPGMGFMAHIIDTEGNRIGLHTGA